MTYAMNPARTRSLLVNAAVNNSAVLSAMQDNGSLAVVAKTAPVVALGVVGSAFAQTTSGSGVDGLNISSWLGSINTAIADTFNASGPTLYKIMGLVGGFFFVWNRVRSLW